MTPERLTQIRQRQAKRHEPQIGACVCGHLQEIPTGFQAAPSGPGIQDTWKCAKCGGQLTVTLTIGGNEPSIEEDLDELLDALAAVTAERDRSLRDSVNLRTEIAELEDKEERAQARADRLETESNGRLKTLLEKAEEARREWQRAENAEGKADRLAQQLAEAKSDIGHWEHSSEYAGTLLKQAETQLATLKETLKALPLITMVSAKTNDEPQRIYVYIPKAELDALLAEPPASAYTPLPI